MRFYTLKERRPIRNQVVLAKLSDSAGIDPYYVLEYGTPWEGDKSEPRFIESSGERYMTVEEEDIIGWMPIEDLDEIKVGE